jgi:hypothetical protein
MRNCTRDEGRSFEVGNQVLISSHRKLLLSKAMVVDVAETSGLDFRQARLRDTCPEKKLHAEKGSLAGCNELIAKGAINTGE